MRTVVIGAGREPVCREIAGMLSNPRRKMAHRRSGPMIELIHMGIMRMGLKTMGRPYMTGSDMLKISGPIVTLAT